MDLNPTIPDATRFRPIYQRLPTGETGHELHEIHKSSQVTEYGRYIDGPWKVETTIQAYDTSRSTRTYCLVGIVVAWAVAIVAIVSGAHFARLEHDDPDWAPVATGRRADLLMHIYPLLINILITILQDATGLVHAMSLKWALQSEARLTFNSNLRLLTSAKSSMPNAWYSNTLVLIASIWTYACTPMIFWKRGSNTLDQETQQRVETSQLFIDWYALVWLGIGLLVLAIMTTWSLFGGGKVLTWSTHPLDTAQACLASGAIHRVPGRCMVPVHDAAQQPAETLPQRPATRQKAPWSAHPEIRLIVYLVWGLTVLGLLFGVILVAAHTAHARHDPNSCTISWSLILGSGTTSQYDPAYCPAIWADYYAADDMTGPAVEILMQCAFQGLITLALHCVELLVNVSRDEDAWRAATSARGCRREGYNSFWAAWVSWQNVVLFAFKPVVHWFFGLAISTQDALRIWAAQMIYLSILVGALAVFATFLSLRRPNGPQPAAYGHLQTLTNLVDQWSPTMHWGDKSVDSEGVGHGGTSDVKLPGVDMGRVYAG